MPRRKSQKKADSRRAVLGRRAKRDGTAVTEKVVENTERKQTESPERKKAESPDRKQVYDTFHKQRSKQECSGFQSNDLVHILSEDQAIISTSTPRIACLLILGSFHQNDARFSV